MAENSGIDDGARGVVALAAGGTGGHLFPALALAQELSARGHVCVLFTEERARRYLDAAVGALAPFREVVLVPAATISLRQPWRVPGQAWRIVSGVMKARAALRARGARCVVGFGGYPSLPPLLAAHLLGLPVMTHDAGVAIGKANRLMAPFARRMFVSFPEVTGLPRKYLGKTVHTGNPVREEVLKAAQTPYAPPRPDGPFRLLVTGGSQGAHFFAEAVPAMLRALPEELRGRVELTMQCRAEDMEVVKAALAGLSLKEVELAPFLVDLPWRMAAAQLVIARAGASTVTELLVIGRPAILVPYPYLADDEQGQNAEAFARMGAGWVVRQHEADGKTLARLLAELMTAPEKLRAAHEAAVAQARPDAAKRMADVVEQVL